MSEFKKYTKKEILAAALNIRSRGEKAYTMFFEINDYKFGVVYKPNSFGGWVHFEFFCLCDALRCFTETGYISLFSAPPENKYNHQLIQEFLFDTLREEGLAIDQAAQGVQLSLF